MTGNKLPSLKSLLIENPDTLVLRDSKTGESRYIGYGGKENAATGIIFNDPKAGTELNYVVLVDDPEKGVYARVELHNSELNSSGEKFLSHDKTGRLNTVLELFSEYEDKGHSSLESFIENMFVSLYPDEVVEDDYGYKYVRDHFEEVWRFRIFIVDRKRYFTIWESSTDLFKNNLNFFVDVVKNCGFDPNTILWEVNTHDLNVDREERVRFFNLKALKEFIFPNEKVVDDQTESTIQKRMKELSKKLSDMEAEEHVKGATWSNSEKKRYKLDLINLKAELDALGAANKSGEKEIKNVVIKTIDSLEDEQGDVIPADILYAELEKKLSHYGTSAVAIIRNLRDRGIDIKKALREINEKFDGKVTSTELLSELSKYINETVEKTKVNEDENTSLIQTGTIQRFKETASTPEEFLRTFKGHKLKELLDKLSFCRLYVMNKFGDYRGDHPQQKFVWLLDHAIGYVNYRLIMPLRKKVDDEDKEDHAKPEVIAQRKKKLDILKQSFAAQRNGDHDRASKLRQLYRDTADPDTRYSSNMKNMEAEIEKIHSTPLSLEELAPPGPDANEKDKKNYEYYVEAFNQFKSN